jgi:NAD(P)-dependent dehydrogenase (short-subunit alcohol dehydrogenase family)
MKIVVIGATGAVGKAVVEQLGQRHEIVTVGSTHGQHQVRFEDEASVRAVTAGELHFGPLHEMTPEQFRKGLDSKLMGQVNVALIAQEYLNDGGSITLTSGIVGQQPIRFGANATAVNAAVEGFVLGASVELKRGLRINAVSPTVLTESMEKYGAFFHGFEPADAKRVALAYSRSVEGVETGKTYKVW